jgi:hypothetical protein
MWKYAKARVQWSVSLIGTFLAVPLLVVVAPAWLASTLVRRLAAEVMLLPLGRSVHDGLAGGH